MRHKDTSRQLVDRFLTNLGEPVSELQSEHGITDVLARLRADDVQVVRIPDVKVSRQPRTWAWTAIGAAIAVMVAGGLLQMIPMSLTRSDMVAKSLRGELHQTGIAAALRPSQKVEAGRVVRAGGAGGAIALLDGSAVEMSPNAELSIIREADGLLVQLNSGTVLVTAAKQSKGHLYVQTKDCLVSVVGTVFAVSAEEKGSRVSVLEGEVHVQRGDISQTLLAGQQASTSPNLGPFPADVSTSGAEPQLALVQQPGAPSRQASSGEGGVGLTGTVRQASNRVGIADVTVTLCPVSAATRVRWDAPPTQEGQTERPNQWRVYGAQNNDKKVFFFALWDQTICQAASSATTDSSGRFQFSNVLPGEYVVTASREGFAGASTVSGPSEGTTKAGIFRYWQGWNSPPVETTNVLRGESQMVTVEAQKSPQDVALNMVRAGVISGHVRDAEGRLLVNAQVRIVSSPIQNNPGSGAITFSTLTNDLGEYRAYWLLPGEYRIAARPADRLTWETWFPRAANITEGTAVSVREGEEVLSIDIIVRPPLPSDAPVLKALPPVGGQIR